MDDVGSSMEVNGSGIDGDTHFIYHALSLSHTHTHTTFMATTQATRQGLMFVRLDLCVFFLSILCPLGPTLCGFRVEGRE